QDPMTLRARLHRLALAVASPPKHIPTLPPHPAIELIPHVPGRAIATVLPQSQVLAGLVHADRETVVRPAQKRSAVGAGNRGHGLCSVSARSLGAYPDRGSSRGRGRFASVMRSTL